MFWIFLGPVLLLLIAVPALLPYRSFRLARGNARRADGSRSRSRARREARHAARFLTLTLLLPLAGFVLLESGLFLFHRHVVPNTRLHELFGEYFPETSLHAPDLEAWRDAVADAEHQAADEARREAEGRAPRRRHTPQDALAQHWPLHIVFLIGPALLLAGFLRWHYLPAAVAYHAGVQRRYEHYRRRALRT